MIGMYHKSRLGAGGTCPDDAGTGQMVPGETLIECNVSTGQTHTAKMNCDTVSLGVVPFLRALEP